MTDHQQAALEATANSLRQIEPNLYENPYNPERYYSFLAQDAIAAAEPHLRKKWAEEAETLMPEMGSHINVTPYRQGVADGINRVLRLLEGAGE